MTSPAPRDNHVSEDKFPTFGEEEEAEAEENQRLRAETAPIEEETTRHRAAKEAAEARIAASKARLVAMEAKIAALRAKRAALKAEAAMHKAKTAILKAKAKGTYYASIDEVWGPERRPWHEVNDAAAFQSMRRTQTPTFPERGTKPSKKRSASSVAATDDSEAGAEKADTEASPASFAYPWTKAKAELQNTDVADGNDGSESSHSSSTTTRKLWPTDIFSRLSVSSVAQLVPADPTLASLYADVARCALPLLDDARWETVQKAIHGSTDPSESSRIPSTGLKHLVSNKIRLSGHDVYFDRNPCVLIVPVLTLQQVVEWQGGGYQAIVMAGAIDEQIVQHTRNQSVSLEPITLQEVNGGICMSLEDKKIPHEIANENHVRLARELLLGVVNGMAYSLIHRLAQTSQFE